MDFNLLNLRRTALLLFDRLDVPYHGASQEKKERMHPVVANAVRLHDAAQSAAIPIMFAKAKPRPDGTTNTRIITGTDLRLRLWPNSPFVARGHAATAGSWEAEIIDSSHLPVVPSVSGYPRLPVLGF
ncbi:MAG: hypothetical protein ACE5HC_03615 [Candidatus Binatia bacterium]